MVVMEVNNTNQAFNVTGAFGTVNLDAGSYMRLVVSLSVSFPGVEIEGDFGFSGDSNSGTRLTHMLLFSTNSTKRRPHHYCTN